MRLGIEHVTGDWSIDLPKRPGSMFVCQHGETWVVIAYKEFKMGFSGDRERQEWSCLRTMPSGATFPVTVFVDRRDYQKARGTYASRTS